MKKISAMALMVALVIVAIISPAASASAASYNHFARYLLVTRWNTHDPRVQAAHKPAVTWRVFQDRRKGTHAFYRADEQSIDPAKRFGEYDSICYVGITRSGGARLLMAQTYGNYHC